MVSDRELFEFVGDYLDEIYMTNDGLVWNALWCDRSLHTTGKSFEECVTEAMDLIKEFSNE